MITLILSSSLAPHLPSIWPISIRPQATSLSLRITLQFSVTMFTVAASCNCLVYTLSLNTTQNETLPSSLLSTRDRTLPLLSLCCDSLHMYFVQNCTCWNIYNVFSTLRIVSLMTALVRVRRSDSDSRPLSPAPAPTMRWQQHPEPHCHSPSNTCPQQNIKTNGFWHNKATLSPPPRASIISFTTAKSGANVQTIKHLAI